MFSYAGLKAEVESIKHYLEQRAPRVQWKVGLVELEYPNAGANPWQPVPGRPVPGANDKRGLQIEGALLLEKGEPLHCRRILKAGTNPEMYNYLTHSLLDSLTDVLIQPEAEDGHDQGAD